MPDTTQIVLKDGNFIRQTITEEILGSQEHVLAACSTTAGIYIKNAMPYGNKQLDLIVSRREIVAIVELDKLPFKTYFELLDSDPTILVPVLLPHRGTIMIDDPWKPGDVGKLIFALKFTRNDDGVNLPNNCYFWIVADGELRKLPYPNTYEDGRICMGNEWQASANKGGVVPSMIHAVDTFFSTAMNKDLQNFNMRYVFNRKVEGGWNPPDKDWKSYCPPAVPAFMQGYKA
jgi:hypothetical protein